VLEEKLVIVDNMKYSYKKIFLVYV